MEKKFNETSIPEDISREAANQNLIVGATHVDKIATIFITAVSDCLREIKNIDKPQAVVVRGLDNRFICAGIIQYIKNEDEPSTDNLASGNWSYSWTFDEDDLKELNANEIDFRSSLFTKLITGTASKLYGMAFDSDSSATTLSSKIMDAISHWLDDNAKEGEETTLILDNVFKAVSTVDTDGKVEKSFVPEGEIKVLVKGDEMIQDAE